MRFVLSAAAYMFGIVAAITAVFLVGGVVTSFRFSGPLALLSTPFFWMVVVVLAVSAVFAIASSNAADRAHLAQAVADGTRLASGEEIIVHPLTQQKMLVITSEHHSFLVPMEGLKEAIIGEKLERSKLPYVALGLAVGVAAGS